MELLDEEIKACKSTFTTPRLLALAWLGWSAWLLWEGWNTYQVAASPRGLLPIFRVPFLRAYESIIQGLFALVIGLLFIKKNKQAPYFLLGYLVAGVAFHFVDAVTHFWYSIIKLEYLVDATLLGMSWWFTYEEKATSTKSTAILSSISILFLLATGLVAFSELFGEQNLQLFRTLGIIFFGLFLVQAIPLFFPDLVKHRKWYHLSFPFVGLIPYL